LNLALADITKSFPGVRALNIASLTLAGGEIHALMGENGAGKSTLIKIITGVYRADSGAIKLDGREIAFGSPREAIAAGIAVVHQERNLIPHFSVAENILLERLPTRHGLVDFADANRQTRQHLAKVGLEIDPAIEVRRLSVAQMQMVEIAKALSHKANFLLLDEPTASLTEAEAETLFRLVRQLREAGTAILFVSHKLEEVLSHCDRVTVLRDGETTLMAAPVAELTRGALIEAMIGRSERPILPRTGGPQLSRPRLQIRELTTSYGHKRIDLTVHRGEILGLYGLVGAGRTELAYALLGRGKIRSGQILVDGVAVRAGSVRDAIKRLRIGYVSEDRKYEGVILDHPIRSNVAVTVWDAIARAFGLLTRRLETDLAAPLAARLEIRAPSLEQRVGNLSGGNQQKVSLAKWLASDVDILIVDEPTVGIDIKAKSYIHELINELADRGMAILLISSDMPEMVALADRILVMHEFALIDEFANDRRYDAASGRIMGAIHSVTAGGVRRGAKTLG
jgi:ribose transport system ATP-binding protein